MAEENPAVTSPGAEVPTSEGKLGSETVNVQAEDLNSGSTKEGTMESDKVANTPQTNGTANHVEEQQEEASEKPTAPTTDSQTMEDTEMPDVPKSDEAVAAETSSRVPPANGTPAASKRASMGSSSKKKSSAVPEHKSKKLNRKKSRPLTNLNAQPGEYYMARMKGHPPWPSVICNEDMLPPSLHSSRPVTAQLPDGTFKKPEYAEGGKRAHERTYPIMFLHTNEFAWIPNTELAPLDVESEEVKNPVEKGKSKTLLAAYKKAADNEGLDHFIGMLDEHKKAMEADAQEREELEKERSAKKAKKASRKSDAAPDDEDEMDVDEDEVPEKPKSKKRKKAEDVDDSDEKPAKTPKTATKLKLSTPKTPAAEPSTKKKASKPKAAKAAKSGSEDDAVTPKVEEKPLTPQQAKEIKEKKVLYYRHKLQRGFLARDTAPKEDEMKTMSDFLGELEGYPDLESNIIRTTKIHKVLKGMIKLPSIPLDEEFHFKSRSVDLLAKWNEILGSENPAGPSGDKDDDEAGGKPTAPVTNGLPDAVEQQAEKAEAGEAAAPEEETPAKMEKKIGTTVEGEKEASKPEDDTAPAADPEKTAEEQKTDAPAVDSAPEASYKPEATAEATA